MYELIEIATGAVVAIFESHAEAWAELVIRTDCYLVEVA